MEKDPKKIISYTEIKHKTYFFNTKIIEKRPRCKCNKEKGKTYCDAVKHWIFCIQQNHEIKFSEKDAENLYMSIHKSAPNDENFSQMLVQIEKDIPRTFADRKNFKGKEGEIVKIQLKNILCAVAKANPEIGYVQGMNFIVGTILYHSSEHIAFWLFLVILKYYGMNYVYEKGMPGLVMHAKLIDFLLQAKYSDIWENMQEYGINSMHFAMKWIVGLFMSLIDIQLAASFFTSFFSHDWVFIYNMSLTIIGKCQDQLINTDYSSKVLAIEECKIDQYGPFNKLLKAIFKEKSKKIIWNDILKKAASQNMNSKYIKELWAAFDMKSLSFGDKSIDFEKLKSTIYL